MWTALRNGRPPLRPRPPLFPGAGGLPLGFTGPLGLACLVRTAGTPPAPVSPLLLARRQREQQRQPHTLASSPFALPCRTHAYRRNLGQVRQAVSRRVTRQKHWSADVLRAQTPIAEILKEQEPWNGTKVRSLLGDKSRINIVSEKLVDDTLNYIGGDLVKRHKGCDLLDVYPGAGVWSSKLHDLLQPRSHILMETDSVYDVFLEPLLERDGVHLIPESGLVWEKLLAVLNKSMLPHQVEEDSGNTARARNDTLVVTINLGFFPPKKWGSQSSLGLLVLYQLITAIAERTLFNKYGLVRMLVWTRDDEKMLIAPRNIQSRRRTALETELYTEWVREIVAADPDVDFSSRTRERNIEILSAANVAKRMREAGIKFPEHRRSVLQKLMDEKGPEALLEAVDNGTLAHASKNWIRELEDLEKANELNPFEKGSGGDVRLARLRHRRLLYQRQKLRWDEAILRMDVVEKAYAEDNPDAPAMEDELAEWVMKMFPGQREFEMQLYRENMRSVTNPNVSIPWDRRPYEPLIASRTEFFPNSPLTLLDIQPKNPHASLLERGPGTNRTGNFADILLKALFSRTKTLESNLKYLWFGAAEAVLDNSPSLRDPAMGGTRLKRIGQLSSRAMSEKMVLEALDAFMSWPFRPDYTTFLAKNSHYEIGNEDLNDAVKAQAKDLAGDDGAGEAALAEDDEHGDALEKAATRRNTILKLAAARKNPSSELIPAENTIEKLLQVSPGSRLPYSPRKKKNIDKITEIGLKAREKEEEREKAERRKETAANRIPIRRTREEMAEADEKVRELVAMGMSEWVARNTVLATQREKIRSRMIAQKEAATEKDKKATERKRAGETRAKLLEFKRTYRRQRTPEQMAEAARREAVLVAQGLSKNKAMVQVKEEMIRERFGDMARVLPTGHVITQRRSSADRKRIDAMKFALIDGQYLPEMSARQLSRMVVDNVTPVTDEVVRDMLKSRVRRLPSEKEEGERRAAELVAEGWTLSKARKFVLNEHKAAKEAQIDDQIKEIFKIINEYTEKDLGPSEKPMRKKGGPQKKNMDVSEKELPQKKRAPKEKPIQKSAPKKKPRKKRAVETKPRKKRASETKPRKKRASETKPRKKRS